MCQCKLPLPWNERFGVYLCTNCGDLADKDGKLMEINPKDKAEFINKIKSLQKKFLELSLSEELLKQKSLVENKE